MKAITSLISSLGWERMCDIAEMQGLSALYLDAVQQDEEMSARIVSSPENEIGFVSPAR